MRLQNILTSEGPLERIGHGHCGSVWGTLKPNPPTTIATGVVLKREDASPGRDIQNEVSVQSQVSAAAESGLLQRSSVPRCFGLINSHDEAWSKLLSLLPDGFEGCRAMIAEKIEPISLQSQLLLIDRYSPERHRNELQASLQKSKPEHCIARIYLGRRRQMNNLNHRGPQFFSLRNFPIHADQAHELQLPCDEYAKAMAEALAVLHWKVRTNGADVEFVLGAHRSSEAWDESTPLHKHALWMLDFDCSRPIRADESGLEAISRAFWRNDPYFPQPNSLHDRDRELWDIFASEYQRVGFEIVQTCPQEGEDVDALCSLVDGALATITATQGKWKTGGYF